jgi:hypothetical protein
MVVAGVWKLFQIGTDLGEIKAILADLRRAPGAPAAAAIAKPASFPPPTTVLDGPISLESAEALLREVAAEAQVLEAAQPSKTAV